MPPPSSTVVKTKQKRKKKKLIKSEEKSIDNLLEPIKAELDKPESLMDYLTFKSFLENVKDSKNTKAIAANYSNDLNKIADMSFNLYPLLTQRSIKSRFTRIRKKLTKTEEDGNISTDYNTENESIISQESEENSSEDEQI